MANENNFENEFCDFLFNDLGSGQVEDAEQHVQSCKLCQSDLDEIWKDYRGGQLHTFFSGLNLVPAGIEDKTAFFRAWHIAAAKHFEESEFFFKQMYGKMRSRSGRELIRHLLIRQSMLYRLLVSNAPTPIIKRRLGVISDSYKEIRKYFGSEGTTRLFGIGPDSYKEILKGIEILASRFV